MSRPLRSIVSAEESGSDAWLFEVSWEACNQVGGIYQVLRSKAPVMTERWRDLLLAEHHALATLAASGNSAARSWVIDHAAQRFLAVERFDRVGAAGRRGLYSLSAVEAEFVGNASAPWPVIVGQLAQDGHVTRESAEGAALLYAFGTLIGNTVTSPCCW